MFESISRNDVCTCFFIKHDELLYCCRLKPVISIKMEYKVTFSICQSRVSCSRQSPVVFVVQYSEVYVAFIVVYKALGKCYAAIASTVINNYTFYTPPPWYMFVIQQIANIAQ